MGSHARSLADSCDVAQSVARRVFEKLDRFQGTSEQIFLGWVGTLTRNRINDELRRNLSQKRDRRRHANAEDLDALDAAAPDRCSQPTPVSAAVGRELHDGVRAAISAEDQHLFRLRGLGLSWEAVARELCLSSSEAARKRYGRMANRLREALAKSILSE